MGYSVYLKSNGETYKLPVNPEEMVVSSNL